MKRGAIVLGTRPEAIKLLPVLLELRKTSGIKTQLISTGQHREMLKPIFDLFEVHPDLDLKIMRPGQSLSKITVRVIDRLSTYFAENKFDFVIVQGDTTSAMATGLAGFYYGIPVIHVEAGLRSYDNDAPFPEEVNRRILSTISRLHFAPTRHAQEVLMAENVPGKIVMAGNTVIDSLFFTRDKVRHLSKNYDQVYQYLKPFGRMVLITCHRRENHGAGLLNVCRAIRSLSTQHPDVAWLFPVHLSPSVRDTVHSELMNVENIFLIEPVRYDHMVYLMDRSSLIMTDSGGIQEEGPTLGKRVIVLRDVTERPEGIEAGLNVLVGTSVKAIVSETNKALRKSTGKHVEKKGRNLYGKGDSAKRIVKHIVRMFAS
jgi:UDP-N-acetylglucosamine 2-epimerase (non-hydrolysing)